MTFTPNPLPLVPANVRLSNPYDLVLVDDQVYVTDGLFFGGPGLLLRFQTPGVSPSALADCLTRPTSMALDEKTNTLYVTELAGRVVAIPVTP